MEYRNSYFRRDSIFVQGILSEINPEEVLLKKEMKVC